MGIACLCTLALRDVTEFEGWFLRAKAFKAQQHANLRAQEAATNNNIMDNNSDNVTVNVVSPQFAARVGSSMSSRFFLRLLKTTEQVYEICEERDKAVPKSSMSAKIIGEPILKSKAV